MGLRNLRASTNGTDASWAGMNVPCLEMKEARKDKQMISSEPCDERLDLPKAVGSSTFGAGLQA